MAQGLALTVVKRSMLTQNLRAVQTGKNLPVLPKAEIRLHCAPKIAMPAKLVVDHLARGLRAHAQRAE